MNTLSTQVASRRAEFEAIYANHSREVWALAYTRRSNAETAREIAHEAFLRLWQHWGAGTAIHNPRAWLLRVAWNLAGDHARSASRRDTRPPAALKTLRAADPAPPECLEREETCARLRGVLDELPRADREILTLRYLQDCSLDEVGRRLALNSGAVYMRLTRARQRLAQRLQAEDPGW
jgi:RNA polymerase sigma-70 factor (ECF subfamily)